MSSYAEENSPKDMKFDFIATPDHAFLLVPENAMDTVNIDADELSDSTKRSRARVFALAEEPDAILFMDRWQARFGPIKIAENRVEMSVIADWPPVQKDNWRMVS